MPIVAAQGQVELEDDGGTAVARARGTCGGDGLGFESGRGIRQGDAGVTRVLHQMRLAMRRELTAHQSKMLKKATLEKF